LAALHVLGLEAAVKNIYTKIVGIFQGKEKNITYFSIIKNIARKLTVFTGQ